jgi:Transposase DDE domain/Insertion element 4 transposase N-terminal
MLKHGPARRRCSRLPDWFMVWFMIALGLFSGDCYRQIYRWLQPWRRKGMPNRSTICEARHRLGIWPLRQLAHQAVQCQATRKTPGAFHRNMRLMGIDGFVVDVPDTKANDKVFGRPHGGRAAGAFPQARVVSLCELGTHVMWRSLIRPLSCGEPTVARSLLDYLIAGMLLLWDRNFLSYSLVAQVLRRRGHLLARVKSNMVFRPIKRLPDRSFLAKFYSSGHQRDQDRDGIPVRIIEYTFRDSGRPGNGERHRLLTTLLDCQKDPAKTLILLYHRRWEEELSIDELKTHQRQRPVLRSETPKGVIQEIYGLLLGHFVIRKLMFEAAAQKQISPLRLSFVGALTILRCRLPECPKSRPALQQWFANLVAEVGEEIIEKRRDRVNPRVIKQKMSRWPKKRPEHRRHPQPRKEIGRSIVMLR